MSRSPNGRYGQGVAVDVAIVGQDVQRRRGVLVGGEAVVLATGASLTGATVTLTVACAVPP